MSVRSLPNRHVYAGDVDLWSQTLSDFGGAGFLKEESERIPEVALALLDCFSLTGDVKLWTKGYVSIAFALDQGREMVGGCQPRSR